LQKVLYFLVTKISNQKGATKNISHRTQNLQKMNRYLKRKFLLSEPKANVRVLEKAG
jgi:hypothetical protein